MFVLIVFCILTASVVWTKLVRLKPCNTEHYVMLRSCLNLNCHQHVWHDDEWLCLYE